MEASEGVGMSYLIRFDFPEGDTMYAGKYKDALGYARTPDTALRFETKEIAERTLVNGYGAIMSVHGTIVQESA